MQTTCFLSRGSGLSSYASLSSTCPHLEPGLGSNQLQYTLKHSRIRAVRPHKRPASCTAATGAAGMPPIPEQVGASEEGYRKGFIAKLLKPLKDFGFGSRSFWEGGVGLFIFAGIGFALVLISWARGGQLFGRNRAYQCTLEFPLACGIATGTPVRIRGVPIGSVVQLKPGLANVDVLVDVKDANTVIPRNSIIEANQSGLIATPLIDITPQLPIPDYKAKPLDSECEQEGKVVCNNGHIKGQPGVAMDDLVYICTKLARQMDAQGIDKVFDAADSATAAIDEARPLLQRAVELVNEITPLLTELREGNLIGNLEGLTQSAALAAKDIHQLQNEVLTEENVRALRESVLTLTKTLENIESITGDVGGLTGDSKVKSHVKQLIEALSRIVSD